MFSPPFFFFSDFEVCSTFGMLLSIKKRQRDSLEVNMCFKGVSSVLQGYFKGVLRVFQGSLKGVSRKFKWCFKEV